MKLRGTSLLTFLITILTAGVARGGAKLCLNADNVIDKLYINGLDATWQLGNRNSVKYCDCIELPKETVTVAIQARNLGGQAGIQECRTRRDQGVFDGWRCIHSKRVTGQAWYSPGYNDKWWQPAQSKHWPKKKLCKGWGKLPCQLSRNWFWAKNQLGPSTVVCRIEYCAYGCSQCGSSGMGKCDPGRCLFGTGKLNGTDLQPVNGATQCQNKCCLNIKAWGPSEPANGYIKVIDTITGVIDQWPASVDGRYLATIDFSFCSLRNKNYSDSTTSVFRTTDTLNVWNNAQLSPNFTRLIAVDVATGNGTQYSPWIDVWQLGIGSKNALYGYLNHSRLFYGCLLGINNGDVTFSDVDLS